MVKIINKKGSINFFIINIGIIIILAILFAIFIIYTQVINMVMNVKNDLYYITQNGILSGDKENLALYNYVIDNELLKKNIENILNKNYIKVNGSIKSIIVNEAIIYTDSEEVSLHTQGRYNKPIIHIKIEVNFLPLINVYENNKTYKINIHEDVKISMLEYEVN